MEKWLSSEIINVENQCIKAFLESLIDYAGLFPPASLSLEKALDNYISYKQSNDSWMLGSFILPATLLEKLETFVSQIPSNLLLPLSVTGMKNERISDCQIGLSDDLKKIASFRKKHGQKIQVEAFELPMPLSVPKVEELAVLSAMAKKENVKLFCEVTISEKEDWEQQLLQTLDVYAAHNEVIEKPLGVKLRTGGLEAKMFPSPEKVAVFIAACAERKLPLKFTAGLHHPIRMYRDEVQTKMHGFLNVFTAGLLSYAHQLDKEKLVEILTEEDPNHFQFHDQELSWNDVKLNAQDIKNYRDLLFSYGSCSFDEPRDELRELKFLKEASQ